jgi:hypothetical protein
MEIAMEKRVITREKLFSFKTSPVTEVTVFLTVREGEEPLIETEPGILNRKTGINVRLSDLFKVVPIDDAISQEVGDGPETDMLDKEYVIRAAQESIKRLDARTGQLKVVWIPDDGLPF